jgi:hypothetical protein
MDVSQISTGPAPLILTGQADSSNSPVDSSNAGAQIAGSNFPSVLQNLQNTGAVSSSGIAMLQALQKNAGTGSSLASELLAQDASAMVSGNSDMSMLQSLGTGSNSSVLNLLQSIYSINSQTNASILENALAKAKAGTTQTDPGAQDATLEALLQPQSADDNSTDPLEGLLSSDSASNDPYQTLMQLATPPDVTAALQGLQTSDSNPSTAMDSQSSIAG